jgi:uncharacterized protein
MLDGYLCGVLVQPVLLERRAWLPHVFDFEAGRCPTTSTPPGWSAPRALILRRHAALNRAMVEDGWFDPLILESDDETRRRDRGGDRSRHDPVSQALMPWVAGFQHATICFPDLAETARRRGDGRRWRACTATCRRDRRGARGRRDAGPRDSRCDAGRRDRGLVVAVADLSDLTREQRYKVDTIKRETPKVGRNDPCPCGSGKKYKQCHGA